MGRLRWWELLLLWVALACGAVAVLIGVVVDAARSAWARVRALPEREDEILRGADELLDRVLSSGAVHGVVAALAIGGVVAIVYALTV